MHFIAVPSFSIFSLCCFRRWRRTLHPPAPKGASISLFPLLFVKLSINRFTSASCVERRVGVVRNGCTLGPKSYPSSRRPNLRLADSRIHGQIGLAWSNTGSDTCVQYALLDQSPEGTGSWSRMERSFELFLVTDCGGFAESPRRFHTPVHSEPHSRESPSIGSSLTSKGHISQSCGADIHSIHSFLAGTRRLIFSAAAWDINPSPCMGIDASIAKWLYFIYTLQSILLYFISNIVLSNRETGKNTKRFKTFSSVLFWKTRNSSL